MREMKDSGLPWLSMVPLRWDVRKVKHFYKMQTGFTPDTKKDEFYDDLDGKDWVTIGDLRDSRFIPSSTSRRISQKYIDMYNPPIVRKGSLLYSFKLSVGQVAFADRDIYTNEAIASFSNDNEVCLRFLFYSSFLIIENSNENIYGAKLLNQELIKNAYIVYPPLDEQKKIADYLDSKCSQIDAIISKQEQIIEKLKEYKLSVITEAVTKGLNPNVEMKDSGVEWIGKIPKHWFITQLKRFCYFKTGTTPKTSNPLWFDGSLKWYTPMDFSDNYVLGDSFRTLTYRAKQDNVATIIPKNTVIIIGIGGTAGKIGLTLEECSCNQQLTAIISQKIHHKYLMYWMIANSRFLKETALYTTLPIINNRTLADYLLIFPKDAQEQLKISDYLDLKCLQIDKTISDRQIAIEKLQEYKKSLIYEVVTGKREV